MKRTSTGYGNTDPRQLSHDLSMYLTKTVIPLNVQLCHQHSFLSLLLLLCLTISHYNHFPANYQDLPATMSFPCTCLGKAAMQNHYNNVLFLYRTTEQIIVNYKFVVTNFNTVLKVASKSFLNFLNCSLKKVVSSKIFLKIKIGFKSSWR